MKKATRIRLSLVLTAIMLIAYWIYSFLSIDYDRLNLAISYAGQFAFSIRDKNGSILTGSGFDEPYNNVCPKDLFKKVKLRAVLLNDKKAITYLYKCYPTHNGYDNRLMWLLYAANQKDKEAIKLLRVKNYKSIDEYKKKYLSTLNPLPPEPGDILKGILQLNDIRDGNISFWKDTPNDFKEIPLGKLFGNHIMYNGQLIKK